MHRPLSGPMARARVAAGALIVLGACGGGDEEMPRSDVPQGSRGETAIREQCNGEGRAVDVNNDGSPDIRHVARGGVDRCIQFDMNFDGMVDITRFFDEDGRTIVREEHDFDFDGRLDQISYFENGEIVRSELDTNFDNRIDTWLWCQSNLLERSERDRRHNGRPDTWEFFQAGLITEARYDENNDGEPDRWEMFTTGRLSQVRRENPNGGDPLVEDIPSDSAGGTQEVLTCDGSTPPAAPAPAAPATPAPTAPA
ncbi:MAG: hypothetical protein J0L92_35715, partial [Deltaproteobacteria bacterium]|nr:hypothetical protein [Deltaproteobacteria bacterium]